MASHPEFGSQTTGSEVAEIFSDEINAKTILITGVGPKGIGASAALAFASGSPELLILASRTKSKVEDVANTIRTLYPSTRVATVILDLASQSAVKQAVAEVKELTDKLDILINNAAVVVTSRQWASEGIELQFGTNHIGPFLFTNLLFPLLLNAAKGSLPGATRIVNVTSLGHRLSPIRFHDYNQEGKPIPPEEKHFTPLPGAFGRLTDDGYNSMVAYGQSKTANILFAAYLQEHLADKGITSYALHPGSIATELGRDQDEELNAAIQKTASVWKTADEGCATTLVAALDPALYGSGGLFLSDCKLQEPAAHAKGSVLAKKLWHLSEDLVGQKFLLD